MTLPRHVKWPLWAAVALTGLIFVYSIAVVTATAGGKYGRHLLELISG